jgi:hypothetical protein
MQLIDFREVIIFLSPGIKRQDAQKIKHHK